MKIGPRFLLSVSGTLLISFIAIFIAVMTNVNSLNQNILDESKKEYEAEIKKSLKNSTDIIFSYIENKYKNADDKDRDKVEREIMKDISEMRYDNGVGYFWINDTGKPFPIMIMHPTSPSLNGKILDDPAYNCAYGSNVNLFTAFVDVCQKNGEGFVDYLWPKPLKSGLTEKTPKISYVRLYKPLNWIIGTGVYVDDINKIIKNKKEALGRIIGRFLIVFISVVIVTIVLSLLIIRYTTGRVVKPIYSIKTVMKDIAEKDGDLTRRIDIKSKDELGELAGWFNIFEEKIENTLARVIENAKSIAGASSQITEGNQDLSNRTERQAASLEETAGAMEEMLAAIRQNSSNAIDANKMAQESKEETIKGVEMLNASITQMEEITASSKKISDVTGIIEEIAFQTNILSLNAAVEAARAGASGRGFAVVASEVRSLAQKTASSVKEINYLITDNVEKIVRGTIDVTRSGEILQGIKEKIITLAQLISEISSASVQQQESVEQTNQAVVDMDEITQQNASLVEELASSSEELSSQAKELVALTSYFKVRHLTSK